MPATLLLLGAWIAIYALQWRLDDAAVQQLQEEWGLRPARVVAAWTSMRGARLGQLVYGVPALLRGGVLPFVTYALLHAGVMHVLGNVLFAWTFASRLEARAGWRRFSVFWVLTAAAGGVAQVVVDPQAQAPVVGASGAIAGAMAAYLLFHRRARILLLIPVVVVPVFVEVPVVVLVVGWAALQFEKVQQLLALGPAQGLAYGAHVGGLAAGVVLGPLLLRRRKRTLAPGARTATVAPAAGD